MRCKCGGVKARRSALSEHDRRRLARRARRLLQGADRKPVRAPACASRGDLVSLVVRCAPGQNRDCAPRTSSGEETGRGAGIAIEDPGHSASDSATRRITRSSWAQHPGSAGRRGGVLECVYMVGTPRCGVRGPSLPPRVSDGAARRPYHLIVLRPWLHNIPLRMRFENQVAVVTGAGRGIGHAIAVRLAKEGARVASVSRTESNAQKTADEINSLHADAAKAYAVDVADQAAVQKAAAQIFEDFGRVDILVHNAGVTRAGLSMRMSMDDWDTVLNTNLKGAFNFAQAVMRPMIKPRSCRNINT